MLLHPEGIAFRYSDELGDWLVQYKFNGLAHLHRLVNPDALTGIENLTEAEMRRWFQMATGEYRAVDVWMHEKNLQRDVDAFSRTQLEKIYRDLFISDHIYKTCLETPSQAGLRRLNFSITVQSGAILSAVMRENGTGYVLRPARWEIETANEVLHYLAFFPMTFLHAPIADDTFKTYFDTISALPAEQAEQACEEFFWSRINPGLPIRWVKNSDELLNKPLEFTNCEAGEFIDLLTSIGRLDRYVDFDEDTILTLWVESATNDTPCCCHRYINGSKSYSAKSHDVVTAVSLWAAPRGYTVQYEGGNPDLWENYEIRPHDIEVQIKAPTATERMEALERLLQWGEKTGVNIEDYLPA